jgi:TolB-like protein
LGITTIKISSAHKDTKSQRNQRLQRAQGTENNAIVSSNSNLILASMDGFFRELKRRNVVRVGIAYVVLGWFAVEVAGVLFDTFGTPDWVLKTVIVLIAIGFPFALLFAWAFEITPEGVKKTRDVPVSASVTASTGRKLDYVIIATLVVALGYFIWERQSHNVAAPIESQQRAEVQPTESAVESAAAEAAAANRSIAVLPFVNMSSDTEQEWFADGLTEEILNSLARTPDLLVAARTSSFGYKGSSESIPTIASELGVDHVLEGSVRKGGDRLRITAQLIRADDGFHLWSETYDRTPDDIIAIQEEIAIRIATALETAMDPQALADMMSAGTRSVPAYEAYLLGNGALQASGESGDIYLWLDARDAFENAVGIDPDFSAAYGRLHLFWALQLESNQVIYGLTDLTYEERLLKRGEALNNAIRSERDATTLLRYQALKAWDELQPRRALRLISEFLKQRPNAERGHGMRMTLLRQMGKNDEIVDIIQSEYATKEFTRDFANQWLQGLRGSADEILMRTIANDAIANFRDDVTILYQAHRLLLFARDIDGASKILTEILDSNMPRDNLYLAELRQTCAEQRNADAARLHARALRQYPDDLSFNWLSYKILGDDKTADELFVQYDESGDFETIYSYIAYPHFDVSLYPNFARVMAGRGIEDREIIELPYRCNR